MSGSSIGLNLLIPDKRYAERDALAEAFASNGGKVHRLGRFWEPPSLDAASVRVYGADTFCLVLQQKLGFDLCSPPDDLLLRVPPRFLQRRLEKRSLSDVQALSFPVFIKPVTPKQFRGAVYGSALELAKECRGLPPETAIFVSEVVPITAEVRSFVLNSLVLDASVYEGTAATEEAVAFTNELTHALKLPRTVVIDTCFIARRGWAVVEFNASWGAGLNGCDASKVLPGVLAASDGRLD